MKTVGWILIIAGVLMIIARGMNMNFEGISNAIVPIVVGVIILIRESLK